MLAFNAMEAEQGRKKFQEFVLRYVSFVSHPSSAVKVWGEIGDECTFYKNQLLRSISSVKIHGKSCDLTV